MNRIREVRRQQMEMYMGGTPLLTYLKQSKIFNNPIYNKFIYPKFNFVGKEFNLLFGSRIFKLMILIPAGLILMRTFWYLRKKGYFDRIGRMAGF